MVRLLNCLIILCLCGLGANAADPHKQMYDLQVKGLGEFMARFNSDEHIFADTPLPKGMSQRCKDILTVCDMDLPVNTPMYEDVLKGFIETVERDSIRLNFSDSTWYACAVCDIQYKKKQIELNLLRTPHEARPNRYTWAIIDVGGKNIQQLADTTKWVGISPTDNELDFIDLVKKSGSVRQHFPGFRKPGKDIDYLSAFVALVQAGVVTINCCNKITYYFLNVPGYVFTVENLLRDGSNSGWLITSLTPIEDTQKQEYLKSMFNY